MSAEIVLAQKGLAGDISRLVADIEHATLEDAKTAHDRMGVAREWAKLQENSAELAERLCWLEAVILRRIGQLDVTILRGIRRTAARGFAALTVEEMAKVFADYPARTAIAVYNYYAYANKLQRTRARGQDVLHQRDSHVDLDEDFSETVRDGVESSRITVRQAAAIIVNEYASWRARTVADIVEEFINDEMPSLGYQSQLQVTAFRRGLTDAVREAFAIAPVVATARSWEIPAFITVHDEELDTWVRVPSEFATVRDAKKMLATRRGQVASATRSLEELERIFRDRFRTDSRPDNEWFREDSQAARRREERSERAQAS